MFQEHLLEYSQPLSKTLWILFPFNHSQKNKNFEDTHEWGFQISAISAIISNILSGFGVPNTILTLQCQFISVQIANAANVPDIDDIETKKALDDPDTNILKHAYRLTLDRWRET